MGWVGHCQPMIAPGACPVSDSFFLPRDRPAAGDLPSAMDPAQVGAWAQHPDGLLKVLQPWCRQLVQSLRVVQGAGVVVQFRGAAFPLVWTAPWVRELADNESEYRDGPCLRALHRQQVVACKQTELLARWPTLGAATTQAGVRAVHAEPLPVNDRPVGVLTLYSTTSTVIDPSRERLSPVRDLFTAALTAYCLAHPHEDHTVRLHRELHNQQLLGHAVGILMARHGATEELARRMLTAPGTDGQPTTSTTARALIRKHLAASHPPPGAA